MHDRNSAAKQVKKCTTLCKRPARRGLFARKTNNISSFNTTKTCILSKYFKNKFTDFFLTYFFLCCAFFVCIFSFAVTRQQRRAISQKNSNKTNKASTVRLRQLCFTRCVSLVCFTWLSFTLLDWLCLSLLGFVLLGLTLFALVCVVLFARVCIYVCASMYCMYL